MQKIREGEIEEEEENTDNLIFGKQFLIKKTILHTYTHNLKENVLRLHVKS